MVRPNGETNALPSVCTLHPNHRLPFNNQLINTCGEVLSKSNLTGWLPLFQNIGIRCPDGGGDAISFPRRGPGKSQYLSQ
jgi:hypothetical protein